MSNNKRARAALGIAATGAMLAGGLAATAPAMAATPTLDVGNADITTWNAQTDPGNVPTDWFKQVDNQMGAGVLKVVADGSSEAAGDGSLRLATPDTGDKVALQHVAGSAAGSPLKSFTTGSYAVRSTKGTSPANYQLVLDCNGGTLADGGYLSLNYVTPSVTEGGGYKTLDVVDGGKAQWWAMRTINGDGTTSAASAVPTPSGDKLGIKGGQDNPQTLDTFKAACSDGLTLTYGVNLGSGSPGLDSNVDSIVYNDQVTNFDFLTRLAGDNRVLTGIAASKAAYPGKANAAVIAGKTVFADGLSGTPLAVKVGGPLLLSGQASLDLDTAKELSRVLDRGATVYVLGDEGALSARVAEDVQLLGFKVVRLGGQDRYDTAIKIAGQLGNPNTVLLTSGLNFPDALSAAPAAASVGGAILLTKDGKLPTQTASYLGDRPNAKVYAIGGPAAQAAPKATAVDGKDRYDTSVKTAALFFKNPAKVSFASGLAFPDALTGGTFAGSQGMPVVLVNPAKDSSYVSDYLKTVASTVNAGWVFGGVGVMPPAAITNLNKALSGS